MILLLKLSRLSKLSKMPPKPEIIDDKHQRFNGVVYTRDSKKHYRVSWHIQREVWNYYYGEIPPKHEIHHRDLNSDNNIIENLQLLTKSEHQQLHTPKGFQAVEFKEPRSRICLACGKEFQTTNVRRRYCSEECYKIKCRKYETRVCAYCGKEFDVRADLKNKCCSSGCARKLFRNSHPETRICPICGKSFEVSSQYVKNKTCSVECGHKLQKITRANSTSATAVPLIFYPE